MQFTTSKGGYDYRVRCRQKAVVSRIVHIWDSESYVYCSGIEPFNSVGMPMRSADTNRVRRTNVSAIAEGIEPPHYPIG